MSPIEKNESKTEYFEANSSIFTWQGICSTNYHNEYIITGTQNSGQGAIYKGPINNMDQNFKNLVVAII